MGTATDAAPWIAAAGGVAIATAAGFWQQRQAKAAAAPSAQSALNDGFMSLIVDLRNEVHRLSVELGTVRESLLTALTEVEACEEARRETERRMATLESQLAQAGLLDRRKSNEGPPRGGRDRRSP